MHLRLALLLSLAIAPAASAATVVDADVGPGAQVAVTGDVVVWTRQAGGGRWDLRRLRPRGAPETIGTLRSPAFDVGIDAAGRPVVAASDCVTATRCRVLLLDVLGRRTTRVRGLGGRLASPSLWRGRLAYARGSRIYVRDRAGGRERRIRVGRTGRRTGRLDLFGRHLVVRWSVTDGEFIQNALRVTPVAGGPVSILAPDTEATTSLSDGRWTDGGALVYGRGYAETPTLPTEGEARIRRIGERGDRLLAAFAQHRVDAVGGTLPGGDVAVVGCGPERPLGEDESVEDVAERCDLMLEPRRR